MKQHSIIRLGMVLLIFGAGLVACTQQPVKTVPEESVQSAMQAAKDAYQRKDFKLAAEWFRKAADLGDAKAQYNLGVAYNEGKGVPQDFGQAAVWFRKAAEQGIVQAQNNLGFLYKQGQGAPQDYAQAAEWFQKAADQGFAQAQHNLGLAYRDGQGVKQDRAQAVLWLQKAAAQDDEQAQADLKELKSTGKNAAKNTSVVKPAPANKTQAPPKKAATPSPAKPSGGSRQASPSTQ